MPVRRSSFAFSRKNKLRIIRAEFSALASLHCRKDRKIRSSYANFTSWNEWYYNLSIFICAFPLSDAVSQTIQDSSLEGYDLFFPSLICLSSEFEGLLFLFSLPFPTYFYLLIGCVPKEED